MADGRPYRLELSDLVVKQLRKLPQDLCRRIRQRLGQLAADPRGTQPQARALKGQRGVFRLRIGEWRALYELDHRRRLVRVLEIGPGHDVYD
ncbi:MAG: type II toxin-antitoxin system RelE/ParE family toxin [Kiloniellales bacterium]|nr:type II toxin-antitoxin system RelE/ParE family toxin [Kiloniellales bacterium]